MRQKPLEPAPVAPNYEMSQPAGKNSRSTGAIKPEEPTYETEKPLEPAPVAPSHENEPTPFGKNPDWPEPSKPEEPIMTIATSPVKQLLRRLTPPAVPTVHFHYNRLFAQTLRLIKKLRMRME